MRGIELSGHARDMLCERDIPEEWMRRAIETPDRTETGPDSNRRCVKCIPEQGGRVLRLVVNHHVTPVRVVTLFFDRRLGRRK